MALSQNLVQKQTQKLVITQDLRQSIELLPLSNLELSDRIQKELVENPLLEEVQAGEDDSIRSNREREKGDQYLESMDERRSSEWKENYDTSSDSRDYSSSPDRTESKHQFLQNAISSPESLADHLSSQLNLHPLSRAELKVGEFLISSINDKGFLNEPLLDLIQGTAIKEPIARKVLSIIYEFDPIGCGAESIAHTLQIQARILRPEDRTTRILLENHLSDLERLDFKKIIRETEITEEELERSMQFIRTLEPFPGTLHSSSRPEYIVPDLIVVDEGNGPDIYINDTWIPGLRINEDYSILARSRRGQKKSEDTEYMQQKLSSAQWLIKSIEQRRSTMYRVMKAILEFQEDFFRTGHANLVPLTLKEVAEKVELHESTISRITTNKYVETRWGIFELKYFFSSSLRAGGGETRSARSVQDRIKQLVDAEGEENPLSDQDIVDLMKKEDVEIARRTVAKYRKILNIPPADRRKKLKRLQHGS